MEIEVELDKELSREMREIGKKFREFGIHGDTTMAKLRSVKIS